MTNNLALIFILMPERFNGFIRLQFFLPIKFHVIIKKLYRTYIKLP